MAENKEVLKSLLMRVKEENEVKGKELEPDIEQWTGSKLGKEYVKAVFCHPVYLTYMQSISCKMLGRMNQKLESRLHGEISKSQIHR